MLTLRETRVAFEGLRIQGNFVEALFHRGLHAEVALKKALADVGIDLEHLELSYPPEAVEKALVAAARLVFPKLTPEEAQRALGWKWAEGFRHTMLGSVLVAACPLLGAQRVLDRAAKKLALTQNYGLAHVEHPGPRHSRFHYRGHPAGLTKNPELFCGALEGLLALTGETAVARKVADFPDGYTLDVQW